MAHYGSLETQPVSDDVHDIRGTTVRGSDGEKLGKVDDAIFDHDTMEIRYLVVDSGGWLEAETFLLPADSVFRRRNRRRWPGRRGHETGDRKVSAI
ncbi:MAG: PRC-barrel domain-containing protein [Candidatus Sulfotelmatobacter sp.]